MMVTIPNIRLRFGGFILLFSGLLLIALLGTTLPKHTYNLDFAALESKTFIYGKPLPITRIHAIRQRFYKVLNNHQQLELFALNQAHINKGLIAQTYQESPYSLALTALQGGSENQENSIDFALRLTPKNHSLQIILTQLKRH